MNKRIGLLILRTFLFGLLCLGLTGCQDTPIAFDLNQRQANEIISVLAEQGIAAEASRGVGSRAMFIVEVPFYRYSEAVSILHYEGLPKTAEPSISELLSPKGFLPGSRELERMRIDRAVAAELESLLQANPAVSDVRAVVRRPLFEGVGPAPASNVSLVIKKYSQVELSREAIFGLVSNLIPGVIPETVVIDIQDAGSATSTKRQGVIRSTEQGKVVSIPMREFLGWWRVAETDYDKMVIVILIVVFIFLAIGLLVGFSAGFVGRKVLSNRPIDTAPALKSNSSPLSLNSPD